MAINIEKFKAVAETAKAKINDKHWQNAIDKAVAGVVSGWWVITELADGVMVTTETGHTYHANGSCQCRAFELGQPCKHRALARLIDLYNEAETAAGAVSLADDVAATPRRALICEIKAAWPKTWPPIYSELLARFGKSDLDMLDDDCLRRVRLAIAA